MKKLLLACGFAVLALGNIASAAAQSIAPAATEAPAGAYTLDKAHASLTFRVNHIGFSNYTSRFTRFDAKLRLDPKNPSASNVTATVDVRSLAPNTPPAGFLAQLLGKQFFEAAKYPKMIFHSTRVEMTAPNKARITSDLTLHGITHPVVLETTFNGGYAGFALDPYARVGFSAHTTLKRSQFGMGYGVPAPGTTMGVGDDIDIAIECEFTGPAWKNHQNTTKK
ncbi:MAG: polyisoprenoid-binding protein [Proteobacteria bacterium]|nr:polyisoprenoid-binding protein [Pseudomonadota bacterium]